MKHNRIVRSILLLFAIGFGLCHLTACGTASQEQEAEQDVPLSLESPEESLLVPLSDETELEPPAEEANDSSVESEALPEPALIAIDIPDGALFEEIIVFLSDASASADVYVSADALREQAEMLTNFLPEVATDCYFPLEGYILSGHYELEDSENLLQALYNESMARVDALRQGSDMELHELLTRASIVEIESSCGGRYSNPNEPHHIDVMPDVASVIENRIASGTPLQMDVTYFYAEALVENFGADPAYEDLYDTYETPSLPLGPIGSPSEDAIKAVLSLSDTDYFFFVYDKEGNYLFAATYEEHLDNCYAAGIY